MSPRSAWTCILWDVDGTVVDASEGILRRLGLATRHFGHPEVTQEELVHWIGPPMFETFQKMLGMTPEQATEAVAYYRSIGRADGYTTGARLYPGIADLIADVHAAGIPQSTASSKPEVQVRALMEHFGLAPLLEEMVGSSPDERSRGSKAEVIAEALKRLSARGVDVSRPVLVGDRHHDVDGGAVHDVPVVFVRWGFSWPHESEGAAAVVDTVDQLRDLLLVADPDA